jgi:hypothetical protein
MFDRMSDAFPERNDSRPVAVKRAAILYGSEFALLQFTHGAGTAALGWCLPAEWRSSMVSMVAINLEIRFDGVETSETGESVELEERQ